MSEQFDAEKPFSDPSRMIKAGESGSTLDSRTYTRCGTVRTSMKRTMSGTTRGAGHYLFYLVR